jgi:stage V sporulation protein T
MKATGIVRRLDDLGRIVIPKEIRTTLGITEGTPLEIFVENKKVCLQKFEPDEECKDIIKAVIDELRGNETKALRKRLEKALELL